MGALYLALILVFGYYFETTNPLRRADIIRQSGYHLYLRVALAGMVSVIVALSVWLAFMVLDGPTFVVAHLQLSDELSQTLKQHNDYLQAIMVIMLAWGITWGRLIWVTVRVKRNRQHLYDATWLAAHDMERLIIKATLETKPIRVTLENRKIYVGIPVTPDFDKGEIKYLALLPLLSGYAHKDTLAVTLTINYYQHYAREVAQQGQLELSDYMQQFVVVLPVDELNTISYFDTEAYLAIQPPMSE